MLFSFVVPESPEVSGQDDKVGVFFDTFRLGETLKILGIS